MLLYQKMDTAMNGRTNMIEWKETDLWKFTAEHQDADVNIWGGYIGKNDGYTPFGYTVDYENKIWYFGLDGHFIKCKAM